MKLHSLDGEATMAHAHNDAVFGAGGNFQIFRQALAFDDQAVIAIRLEGLRKITKDTLTFVIHERRFAVHWFRGTNDASTVDLADRLVSQADSQEGNARAKGLDDLAGEARFVWRAGSRRDHDMIGLERGDLVQRDLIVAPHRDLRTKLGQILVQVVGKAIVVID